METSCLALEASLSETTFFLDVFQWLEREETSSTSSLEIFVNHGSN